MNYDLPIKNTEEDNFQRTDFINHIKDLIPKTRLNDGFTIGIEGEWGCGKTSILNCLREKLEEDNFKVLNFDILHCKSIKVDLTKHLYEKILNLMYSIGEHNKNKDIIESVSKILEILSISENIIFNSNRFHSLSQKAKGYLDKQKELSNLKSKISSLLSKIKRPIVIYLDDLDRLNKDEIIEIIQLIKFNANFENIVYVLSYDKKIVSNLIRNEQEIDGNDYLKKIIQFEMKVPQISKIKLFNFLDKQLEMKFDTIYDFDSKYFNVEDYYNLKIDTLNEKIKTPRDIKRIVNLFYQDFILLNKDFIEVNPLDLLTLNIIKELFPKIFQLIMSRSNLFIENFPKNNDFTIQKMIFNEIKDENDKIICSKLISYLFPNLNHIFSNEGSFGNLTYTRSHLSSWRNNRRLCTKNYFQKYEDKTINIGGILTEKRFYEILQISKESGNKFENNLIELYKNNLIEEFLSKIDELLRSNQIDESNFNLKNLLMGIAKLGDKLSLNSSSMAFTSPSMRGVRVFYAIGEIIKQNDYFEIIKNIITKISDISLISHIVSIETRRGEEKDKQKKKRFNSKQEEELQKLILEKLNLNFILKSQYSTYLLFLIKDWNNTLFEKIKKEINIKLKDNNFCLHFASKFINTSKSQSVVSNYVHIKKRISKELLFKIVNDKFLIKRLNKINNFKSKEILTLINQKEF